MRTCSTVEAGQVEVDLGVVVGQGIGQRTAQLGAGAAPRQAVIDPMALAHAVEQAGLREQLEMAGNAWLALAEDPGQVRDRQVGVGAQRQQAQPGRLRRRLQGREQFLHRNLAMPSITGSQSR
jgi:hypothetical protein